MRALLILIAVALILVLIGWVTIKTNGDNQATFTVETQKIEQDTHDVVEKSGNAMEEAGQKIRESVRKDAE